MMFVQPWCVIREHAKERSPSPIRRIFSEGENGIVGWVCDLSFELFEVLFCFCFCACCCGFEIPDGRVSLEGLCFLDCPPFCFKRLFLPIVRIVVGLEGVFY